MWTFSSSIVHVCEIEDVNECEIVDAIEEGTFWKVLHVSSKGFFYMDFKSLDSLTSTFIC